MIIFDIGCNVGDWTRANYSKDKKFICVEAAPVLAENTRIAFKDIDNIEVLSCAVSDKDDQEIEFYLTSNNSDPVLSSCVRRWETKSRFKDFFDKKGIKVKTITIDRLIELYGEPEYIKIDVEGYENVVLRGLTHKSGMISFEWGEEEKDCVIENINYLKGLGYKEFALHESDEYCYMPEEWVDYNDILKIVNETLVPERSYKWGMIFAKT
jgi:FkbM family methyltransferase